MYLVMYMYVFVNVLSAGRTMKPPAYKEEDESEPHTRPALPPLSLSTCIVELAEIVTSTPTKKFKERSTNHVRGTRSSDSSDDKLIQVIIPTIHRTT